MAIGSGFVYLVSSALNDSSDNVPRMSDTLLLPDGKAVDFKAEVLPPDRIVFRKYWNDYDNRWTPIAFLPDVEAKPGWIMSYEHCGQHCEASMNYYWDTKPCEPELYAPLLKELESIGYRPRIMKRIMRRKP